MRFLNQSFRFTDGILKMFVSKWSTLSRKRSNMSECDFLKLSFVEEGKDVNDTFYNICLSFMPKGCDH